MAGQPMISPDSPAGIPAEPHPVLGVPRPSTRRSPSLPVRTPVPRPGAAGGGVARRARPDLPTLLRVLAGLQRLDGDDGDDP